MSVGYRVGQFWRGLVGGALSAEATAEIAACLSPAELRLFQRQRPADQRHAYRVMRTLVVSGERRPALLAAALLHDVGKSRCGLPIWGRVAIVLAEKFAPALADAWGEGQPTGWRRPFVVRAQHADWGADMAAAAGSPPLLVGLIRSHQSVPPAGDNSAEASLLRRLQWADNLS